MTISNALGSSFFIVLFAAPAISQEAKEIKFYESVTWSNHFIGYFTPPDPYTKHNFRTCPNGSRIVTEDQVKAVSVSVDCGVISNPYDFFLAKEFSEKAVGSVIFGLSGEIIGKIEAVATSESGHLGAYIISSFENGSTSAAAIAAQDVSAWRANDEISFLTDVGEIKKMNIEPVEGMWLSDQSKSELQKLFGGKFSDPSGLGSADSSGIIPDVPVIRPEVWLDIQ